MRREATLVDVEGGLEPDGEGWFVVNVRDTCWWRSDAFGALCPFEGNAEEKRGKTSIGSARFSELGINVHVLEPGLPAWMYHGEEAQEDFLVLHGECLLVIEGQERRLRAWDFVHCPPWVEHVFVGAGEGPCVVLMVGARRDGIGIRYPVSDVAARHGASVDVETGRPEEAYARFPQWRRATVEDPRLPWNAPAP
jgi:uncharacterized cupin superfamily protein